MKVKINFGSTCINLNNDFWYILMSFAVMSFYKYISKRLYDLSLNYTVYANSKQYGNVLRC